MKLKAMHICMGLFLTVFLSACEGQNPTYEYYMLHPKKIQPKIEKCRELSFDKRTNDKGCISAIQAGRSVGGLLQFLEENPQTFGAKIMSFQIDYVNTQERIKKLKQKESTPITKEHLQQLERHAKDVHYKIEVYRGVVGLVTG